MKKASRIRIKMGSDGNARVSMASDKGSSPSKTKVVTFRHGKGEAGAGKGPVKLTANRIRLRSK